MTKISTKVTLEICDEIGVYNEIERHSYEFDGPIAAQCKKGRDANANNTKFQQSQANQYAGNANTGFNSANDFYQNELNLNPGGMSSPAAAMYASDLANIKSTYNGLKQNAFATAGERGFGNAPSGFMQATQNGLNQAQANAQTQAYNAGIINTQNQRQNAAAGEAGLYGQSTAGEAANTNAANTSAFNQSRSGFHTRRCVVRCVQRSWRYHRNGQPLWFRWRQLLFGRKRLACHADTDYDYGLPHVQH